MYDRKVGLNFEVSLKKFSRQTVQKLICFILIQIIGHHKYYGTHVY